MSSYSNMTRYVKMISDPSNPINPITPALEHVGVQIKDLKFTGIDFLPSVISGFVLVIVYSVFIMLWPYGLIPMVATIVWQLISISREEMRELGLIEKMPYTVAIGF